MAILIFRPALRLCDLPARIENEPLVIVGDAPKRDVIPSPSFALSVSQFTIGECDTRLIPLHRILKDRLVLSEQIIPMEIAENAWHEE